MISRGKVARLLSSCNSHHFRQVLGKGNGINSLPGNLRFRKIIVKYKPLYAATPRSMKGTVAEMVINEIACLDPPGRFLEPQADQQFREVSRKRAIEKTCQALREKKNNIGRPQQVVSPDQDKQQQQQQQQGQLAVNPQQEQNGNDNPLPMQIDPLIPPPTNTNPEDDAKSDTNENDVSKVPVVTVMQVGTIVFH